MTIPWNWSSCVSASQTDYFVEIGPNANSEALHDLDTHFPGLSIEAVDRGGPFFQASGLQLGPGRLYSVTASCQSRRRQPSQPDRISRQYGLMIPVSGTFEIAEPGRRCEIGPGSACIVDGQRNFSVMLNDFGTTLLLLAPREAILRRYPHFERNSTRAFDPEDPGTMILRDMVLRAMPHVPGLDELQRMALLQAIIDGFGLPKITTDEAEWRVQKALSYILANLGDPDLDALAVARSQFISRRSLDELFVRVAGRPVTAEIADCRLTQAAQDLADPAQSGRSIGDIAYGLGFEHAAHFTRAFTRRFGAAPSRWRRRQ